MHLSCPDCGADVPAEDINIDTGLARCRACNGVINVKEAVGAERPAPVKRPRVAQPRAITVEDLGGTGLRLTRSWFTWAVLFMTVFCIIWDSFLIFWYSLALQPGTPWIMAVFPILHVLVGVAIT